MGKRDMFAVHLDAIKTCLAAAPNSDNKLCVTFGLGVLSMALLLLSCSMCKVRGEHPGDMASCSLYGFLGNLSSTVGAFLSKQLTVVIVMGAFAATVDAVNFISVLCPIFFCWNSESARRRRMMRRRRRQYLMAVSVLMIVSGGYLTSTVNPRPAGSGPAEGPLRRLLAWIQPIDPTYSLSGDNRARRLLHVLLPQDNTAFLGYILGIIAFVIACTAKFPTLSRVHKGHALSKARVFSGMLCSLAGALYASALLFYNTKFEFVLETMPWLLSAMCCSCLDLLILVIYWCRREASQHPERCSPDAESLLDLGTSVGNLTKDILTMKKKRKQKNDVKKQAEMGCYLDVGDPLYKVTVAKEGVLESQPHRKMVQEVRVQKLCFLDSSWTSSDSSDLEWDFAEANAHWNKIPVKKGDEFPLQEWPKNPETFGICICGIPGWPEKTVPGKVQECVASVDG